MKRLRIIGNVTKDAVVNEFQNKKVINFSVAVNEYFKDKNGNKVDKASFFNCAIWKPDGNTNIAQYLKKGTKVMCYGSPEFKLFTNNQNQSIIQVDITVAECELLSSSNNNSSNQQQQGASNTNQNTVGGTTYSGVQGNGGDDLPF